MTTEFVPPPIEQGTSHLVIDGNYFPSLFPRVHHMYIGSVVDTHNRWKIWKGYLDGVMNFVQFCETMNSTIEKDVWLVIDLVKAYKNQTDCVFWSKVDPGEREFR